MDTLGAVLIAAAAAAAAVVVVLPPTGRPNVSTQCYSVSELRLHQN